MVEVGAVSILLTFPTTEDALGNADRMVERGCLIQVNHFAWDVASAKGSIDRPSRLDERFANAGDFEEVTEQDEHLDGKQAHHGVVCRIVDSVTRLPSSLFATNLQDQVSLSKTRHAGPGIATSLPLTLLIRCNRESSSSSTDRYYYPIIVASDHLPCNQHRNFQLSLFI